MKAFVPHVGLTPCTLEVEGRPEDATDHARAKFRIVPMRASKPVRAPKLPVAAMPTIEGECWTVHRSKFRPALVVSVGGGDLPPEIKRGLGWPGSPALLVAPYYGVDQNGKRGGWPEAFVRRISRGEYPAYAYDRLPIGGCSESILRLDHIQPVGLHHDSYELTKYELTSEAMAVIDEWISWLVTGSLDPEGLLEMLAGELAKLPE